MMQEEHNTYHSYTSEDIHRYLSGRMPAGEMHRMEKAALNDPLLADAMDGLRKTDNITTEKHLNEIRNHLQANKEVGNRPVVPIQKKTGQKWKIILAAACLSGMIAAGTWWMTKPPARLKEVAQQKSARTDKDSAITLTADIKKSPPANDSAPPVAQQRPNNTRKKAVPPPSRQNRKTERQKVIAASPPAPTVADSLFLAEAVTDTNRPSLPLASIASRNKKKLPASGGFVKTADDSPRSVYLSRTSYHQLQPAEAKNDLKSLPHPEEGWKSFYEKLENRLGVDKSKPVKKLHIQFKMDDNGRPVDFKIVESPDEQLAKKTIEQIQQARWKNYKQNRHGFVTVEVNE